VHLPQDLVTTFLEQGQVFNHFPTAVEKYSVTKHLKTGGQGEAYLGATRTGAIVVIKYLMCVSKGCRGCEGCCKERLASGGGGGGGGGGG
jgi:hypothetical protein